MRARLAWALPMVLAAAGQVVLAQEPALTAVTDVRQESADHSTRLVVMCNGPLTYTYYSPDPLTLVVDLPDVDVSRVPNRISVGTSEVESLRVTPMARAEGRGLARLEVRLARLVTYQIYSKDKALHMVFDRAKSSAKSKAQPLPEPAVVDVAAAPLEPALAPEPALPAPAPAVALPPVEAPKASLPAKNPATRILGVAHDERDGRLAITVRADGRLRYQDFFLGNPSRLVMDFQDVAAGSQRSLDVNQEPVRKMRLAQFSAAAPKVARLVLELSGKSPYKIVEGADGLKIVFGEGGETPAQAPLAALRTEPASEPEPSLVADASPVLASLPPPLAAPDPAAVALPEPQLAPSAESFEPKTVSSGEKKFTGHPISLDFKDGDLQDIFRLFADISGLNVVVNPGVSGKVTLKLTEVPWDQALDLILKTNSLGYTLDDNVIRIAKLTDLQKEETERRKLAEEKALAGELLVWRKSLSYAKASEMEPTVKKVALSARGTITLDERTNTMIITDLPQNIEKAKDLILDLDRATPQVEIEARIVVTTRNFTRDLGVQWGFLNQQTAQFGNTTNLSFPHSIILNGGTVAAGGLSANQGGLADLAGIGPGPRGYAVNLPASAVNSALGVSMGNILGNFNLDAALTALESRGRGRILSTPKVTTQNNQAAEIKQGIQIAVQTFSASTGPTATFKDVFLILKVTPQITEAGTVILRLEVENNSADFSREVLGIPPINVQAVKTNVLVRDGATAVIGGIYQTEEQTSRNSTPFLGDVPILGYLFRSRTLRNQNSELILFITPRIIKS